MSTPAYILTDQAITLFADGRVLTAHADDNRFDEAKDLIRSESWDDLVSLLQPTVGLQAYLSDNGRLTIRDDTVFFDGTPIHTYAARKLIDMRREGQPTEPMVNFLTHVMENPSKRAVDQLLQFMEYGSLPITPDGHFLAYKKVTAEYRDCHSKTIDNSIGQVVSMPRNQVQDDPDITCSYGLHFCSLDYLKSFWGDHVMVLKINPKDVVSIPSDYNNTKGRCCRYEVVAELEQAPTEQNTWGSSVVSSYTHGPENETLDEDENCDGHDEADAWDPHAWH